MAGIGAIASLPIAGGPIAGGETVSSTATTHATTGALTGPGSTVAGSAARTRAHPTSGTLTGPGAAVAGTAEHIAIPATSGVLTGPGATVAGTAARVAAAVTHDTSGALVGPGAAVNGLARGPQPDVATTSGGGWLPNYRRKTRKEIHAERVRLGILPPDVVKAAAVVAARVMDEPEPIEAYRDNRAELNKVFLRELGATRMLPDYTRAIQIQIELMVAEEEEILLLM